MSRTSCARSWEIEAARDGRIGGAARDDLELHVATCRVCRAERECMDALGRALARAGEAALVDELTLRRSRGEALRRADAALVSPRRDGPGRVLSFGLVAAAIAAGAYFLVRGLHDDARPSFFEVTEAPTARWSATLRGDVEHVALSEGSVEVNVHRVATDPRLIVDLPDGTLEDEGTRFLVEVRHGETTSVRVLEGAVTLRRREDPPVRIAAGSSWSPWRDGVASEGPSPATSDAVASGAASTAPRRPEPSASPSGGNGVAGPSTSGPARPLSSVGASASPLAESEAEDAAYLEVLDLARQHRTSEAKALAARYLARFPRGFRRPEMERVAAAKDDD